MLSSDSLEVSSASWAISQLVLMFKPLIVDKNYERMKLTKHLKSIVFLLEIVQPAKILDFSLQKVAKT